MAERKERGRELRMEEKGVGISKEILKDNKEKGQEERERR